MPSPVYKRAVETLEARIGDELVAMDAERGDCFGFNEIAAAVWRMLETPKSIEDLQETLRREYDVSGERCAADLRSLLDELVANQLVITDGDTTS
jgi:hypothetical protein